MPATHPAQPSASTERWERFVWTLTAHPRLHAHPQRVDPARWPADLDAAHIAAHTWWRTERQTFIPVAGLPAGAAQAVFTIKVDLVPLGRAFTGPAQAARVHDALASMSPAVLAYRGLGRVQPALLRWLAAQAAGGSAFAAGGSAFAAGGSPFAAGDSQFPAGDSQFPAGDSQFPAGDPT